MKPTPQISRQYTGLGGERSPSRPGLNHPRTDYNFQIPTNDAQSAGGSRKLSRPVLAPGFRDLSNEFLGAETTRDYVAEVLFFAIIVCVSAWPIVSMVRALAQLMK